LFLFILKKLDRITAKELPTLKQNGSPLKKVNNNFFTEENCRCGLGRSSRVARWFVFKPKTQIWVNFGGPCNRRYWYFLWILCPFYGLLL
jgi:hypothetical protein